MKTLHHAREMAFPLIFALALTPALGAAAPAATATLDHHLFVGQDLVVQVDGKFQPVIGAGHRSFVVEVDHRRREIATNKAKAVRLSRGLKLSTLSASITDIRATTSSDAAEVQQREAVQNGMALMAAVAMQQDKATTRGWEQEWQASGADKLGDVEKKFKFAAIAAAREEAMPLMLDMIRLNRQFDSVSHDGLLKSLAGPQEPETIDIVPEITLAGASLSIAGRTARALPRSSAPSVTEGAAGASLIRRDPVHDLGNGQSDRLDLEFSLSAAHPIDDAYVIVSTDYKVPGTSNEVFRRVLAQHVGRIDSRPRKLSLYQVNFPSGFHIQSYTVSVYVQGQEVATNLSPNLVSLTQVEAFQYVVADYLASHRGQTRPPAAVLMAPRSSLGDVAARDAMNPVYVLVDEAGTVVTISSDEAGARDVEPSVRKALKHFRFIPALDRGIPARGRAKLIVADFQR